MQVSLPILRVGRSCPFQISYVLVNFVLDRLYSVKIGEHTLGRLQFSCVSEFISITNVRTNFSPRNADDVHTSLHMYLQVYNSVLPHMYVRTYVDVHTY